MDRCAYCDQAAGERPMVMTGEAMHEDCAVLWDNESDSSDIAWSASYLDAIAFIREMRLARHAVEKPVPKRSLLQGMVAVACVLAELLDTSGVEIEPVLQQMEADERESMSGEDGY